MSKPRHIEMMIVLAITSFAMHFLVDFGFIPYEKTPVYDRFLITGVIIMGICKLLDMNEKYRSMIILGQIFFVSICILLYYSVSFADYLAFFLCSWTNIRMLLYAKEKMSDKEWDE